VIPPQQVEFATFLRCIWRRNEKVQDNVEKSPTISINLSKESISQCLAIRSSYHALMQAHQDHFPWKKPN